MDRIFASWGLSAKSLLPRFKAGVVPGLLPGLDDLPPALRFLDPASLPSIIVANALYLLAIVVISAVVKRTGPISDGLIKPFMLFYNATCVALAGAVVYLIVRHRLTVDAGSFACTAPTFGTAESETLAWAIWLYYAQKYWEFLDTVIFALRGSFRQLSMLHVYHHVSITFVTAAFARYDVNGDCTLAALANSFIHVLMYSHYFVSAFGMKTPWRKHLTTLQLLQFLTIFAQATLMWTRGPACGYPDWMKAGMLLYQTSMLFLFGKFFLANYAARPKPKGKNA